LGRFHATSREHHLRPRQDVLLLVLGPRHPLRVLGHARLHADPSASGADAHATACRSIRVRRQRTRACTTIRSTEGVAPPTFAPVSHRFGHEDDQARANRARSRSRSR
jgi:hypothetical protein